LEASRKDGSNVIPYRELHRSLCPVDQPRTKLEEGARKGKAEKKYRGKHQREIVGLFTWVQRKEGRTSDNHPAKSPK